MRKIICLVVLIGCCLGAGRSWYQLRDGFSPKRLYGWRQSISGVRQDEEVATAKQQRFYYLDRGRQSFAFVSEDGNYVIKLPRADQFRLPLWLRVIPFKNWDAYRTSRFADKVDREARLLESFRISYDELKDSTAVIGMNLCSNAEVAESSIAIVDRIGRQYTLPLHRTYYVLQHKKRLFKEVYREAVATGDEAEVERVFDWLIQAMVERAKKGILNKDGSFLRNFGYDEKKAYQIDVGSFYYKQQLPPQEAYLRSIEWSMAPVRKWIGQENPTWLSRVDQKLSVVYTDAQMQ